MNITVYFEDSGVPATGLAPTLNIRDISDGSLAIDGLNMTEVGDGFYMYDFETYDSSITYTILCDAGASLSDADRYVRGEFTYGDVSSTVAGGASLVGLANQALFLLGQKAIISLTEDTEAARLCNGRIGYIRDSILQSYPWNCAQVRTSLVRSATAPDWEYDYKFALPTDPYCLRVLKFYEEEEYGYKWKIEGRWLLTDSTTASILYIARVTDVNEMSMLLREAIAARLAADINYALTGASPRDREQMWTLYEQKLRQAKTADAQEGTAETLVDDTFLDARL